MNDREFVWVNEPTFDNLVSYAGPDAVFNGNGPGKFKVILNDETLLLKEFTGIDFIYYAQKEFLDKFKKRDCK